MLYPVFANSYVIDPSYTKSKLIMLFNRGITSQVLYTVNTPTNDVSIIKENLPEDGVEFSEYELYHKIDNKKIELILH